MAKINFNQALKNLDGVYLMEKIQDGKGERDEMIRLKSICCRALLGPASNKSAGDVKVKRYKLAFLINGAEEDINLTAEEITELKSLISEQFPPLVVGQAWEMLDPPSPSPADATEK